MIQNQNIHNSTLTMQSHNDDDFVLDLDEFEDAGSNNKQDSNHRKEPPDSKRKPNQVVWEFSIILALAYLTAQIPYFILPEYGVFGIIIGVLHSAIISFAVYFVFRHFKYYYAQTYGFTFFSVNVVLFALRFAILNYAIFATGFVEALLISIILAIRTDNHKVWKLLLLPWGITEVMISVLSIQFNDTNFYVLFAVITSIVRGAVIGRSLGAILSSAPQKLFGKEKQVLDFDNFNIWNVILFILAAALLILMKVAGNTDLFF